MVCNDNNIQNECIYKYFTYKEFRVICKQMQQSDSVNNLN